MMKKVKDKILGNYKEGFNLYLIVWERIANHGLIYCWASSKEEAYEKYSFKLNKAVRHSIIKLDKDDMPICDGRKAL